MTTKLTDMQPGRELDKLVAEAMGHKVREIDEDEYEMQLLADLMVGKDEIWVDLAQYSTLMMHGWRVFEDGLTRFGWASIYADMELDTGNSMIVTIGDWAVTGMPEWAICIAYLLQHQNGYKENDDAD